MWSLILFVALPEPLPDPRDAPRPVHRVDTQPMHTEPPVEDNPGWQPPPWVHRPNLFDPCPHFRGGIDFDEANRRYVTSMKAMRWLSENSWRFPSRESWADAHMAYWRQQWLFYDAFVDAWGGDRGYDTDVHEFTVEFRTKATERMQDVIGSHNYWAGQLPVWIEWEPPHGGW